MRRALIWLIALTFVLCGAAMAEERMARVISCPEQGFSTLCLVEYETDFTPDGGVTIELGPEDGDPWVSVFKTDAPGADFDAEYYLKNIYTATLASISDETPGDAAYGTYPLGGKEMPGILAMITVDGEARFRFCCYDLEDDYFVRYEASCPAEDAALEETLHAVGDAVRGFQPDPEFYASK